MISRSGDVWHLRVVSPFGRMAPDAALTPAPITDDGPIIVPPYDAEDVQ